MNTVYEGWDDTVDVTGIEEAATKHEQLLKHIEELKVGSKISVRKIARSMGVSEGTAYRAMKEAENRGLLSTKERIGTVRVEKKQRHNINQLTFAEVAEIVDGEVLGGASGLGKTLGKFVIGAMEKEAMMRYIDAGSLLIVGNREEVHSLALEQGAAVLITGGFDAGVSVKRLADERSLPIISTGFDTFTVASIINRAIYDRLIKKKIMLVEDILPSDAELAVLKIGSTAGDWKKLIERTGHDRIPVVDEWNRVVGMVTSRQAMNAASGQPVEKLMVKNPITVTMQTSVASAAHMMAWEGVELLPVVDPNRKLAGVISRKDLLKVMQYVQRQPEVGETLDALAWSAFEEYRDEEGGLVFRGTVTPQVTDHLGSVSAGALTTFITQAAYRMAKEHKKGDLVLDNISTYFIRPVQMDSEIEIRPKFLGSSRKFGKIEVDVYTEDQIVCKAMISAQVFDPS